jgi:hypothetical protein
MGRFVVLGTLAVALVPGAASADVFKLYGELHGGGMYGKGISGDTQSSAFFAQSTAPTYGALVGGRFLILDANIKHHQFPHDGDVSTWTQFSAGLGFGVDMGSEADKKLHKGGYVEMGVWAGFGLATGAQVDPPLDNSEVSDKGFMLDARIGAGKHLSKIFDVGIAVPLSWGYFFRNGEGSAANDISTQYQSVQVEVLLVLRANLRFI